MVVFHIKSGGEGGDEFLFTTQLTQLSDDAIREITKIWNLRLRLAQLCGAMMDLARHGPAKPLNEQGLDSVIETTGGVIEKGPYYCPDPNGMRNGNGIGPQLTETFEMVIRNADSLLSSDNVKRRVSTELAVLEECLRTMGGAVTMAFPMGLPEIDTVRLTLEGPEGLDGTAAGAALLDESTAELWVASRIVDRTPGAKLSDRFGTNEKTKLVAKLQKPGGGAPGREAGISEDERKAMMAFYFKKQEEAKALAEANEDDYLNAPWADSKQLQKSFRGLSDIRAPGVRR